MDEHITDSSTPLRIVLNCTVCGDGVNAPNKGLGRAVAAAWRTQHQHSETGAAT